MLDAAIVKLPEHLKDVQRKWLDHKKDRHSQDIIFYREFVSEFRKLFSELPLHGWRGERPRFRALISILGFSWQPVALMAAWVKPDHMLVLGSKETIDGKLDNISFTEIIQQVSGLHPDCFVFKKVEDSLDLNIYMEIRDFISAHRLKPHEIAIDPTAGKKSMSISAGLAGFLSGAFILYVDYKHYDPTGRIPLAGTEYPRLLDNPLQVFGDLEFDKVWDSYERGSFEEAFRIADDLSRKLYEPREAEALTWMMRGYGAWHQFDFIAAFKSLKMLVDYLDRFQRFGRWMWGEAIANKLEINVEILDSLANLTDLVCKGDKSFDLIDGLPLVFNHLESARRALKYGQKGVAVLLAYSTIERFIDLSLWCIFGLDDEKPDFSRIDIDIESFHKFGELLHGNQYRRIELKGSIGLSLGIQLLATLKPELIPKSYFGEISRLIQHRNKCEYEHGLCPTSLQKKDVEKHLKSTQKLLSTALEAFGVDVQVELTKYRFPKRL